MILYFECLVFCFKFLFFIPKLILSALYCVKTILKFLLVMVTLIKLFLKITILFL